MAARARRANTASLTARYSTEALADCAAQELTVNDVAIYASLAPSHASMLERDIRHPTRDTLIALLLASFSLPVDHADRVLLWVDYAPIRHRLHAP